VKSKLDVESYVKHEKFTQTFRQSIPSSPNFNRGKKSKHWPRFLTPVAFELPGFRNWATYQKSKTFIGSAEDWHGTVHLTLRIRGSFWASGKRAGKSRGRGIINKAASHYPILFKFGKLKCYRSEEAAEWLKSTYGQIQDGRRRQNWND